MVEKQVLRHSIATIILHEADLCQILPFCEILIFKTCYLEILNQGHVSEKRDLQYSIANFNLHYKS